MTGQPSKHPLGFPLYARLAFRTFFAGSRTGVPLTLARFIRMGRFVPVFCLTQVWNRICLRIDDVLFPQYRSITVREPLFVCGMPRCGTTLLHRVLAQDENTTCFRLWELVLAPSIVQRVVYRALGRLDRALGGHVKRGVQQHFIKAAKEMQRYHRVDLWEAEEDDLVLMPFMASAFLFFPFPYYDLMRPLTRFDDALPQADRERVMGHYKRLVQRHLFVYGADKRFLSKNPFMSPKIESLRAVFPDARVVCNVRTPHEAVPSMLSLFRFLVGYFKANTDFPAFVPDNLEIADYFYDHPMRRLPQWPEEQHAFVRYPDLTGSLRETVEALYERFGFPIEPSFRERLEALDAQSRAYSSEHQYSLEEFGLTSADLVARYAAVFAEFDFDTDPAGRHATEEFSA